MMEIDGKTRLCGLIGNPVEHTLSPVIHNTLAKELGINLAYLPFCVEKEKLQQAIQGAEALQVLGLNVTVPYKEAVIPYLTQTEPLAKLVGAVNTLVRTKEGYQGYNTDMSGLYRAMEEDGVQIAGQDVILLGAGGVGRAVAFLCAQKKASQIFLLNRSLEKAREVAKEINACMGREAVHAMALTDWRRLPDQRMLAIQATSVGLFPDSHRAVVEEPEFYEKIHTGYDLIYRPARTKFMQRVESAGGRAYNGLKMLVYQGVEAFEMWTGTSVSKEQAAGIYRLLQEKMKIRG